MVRTRAELPVEQVVAEPVDDAPADPTWSRLKDQAQAADAAAAPPPAGDQPGAPDEPAAQPAPAPTNANAIAFYLQGVRTFATTVLKSKTIETNLGDEHIGAIAMALGPVADKYGMRLAGGEGSRYGAELQALMVAGPILWLAGDELVKELRARKAKPVEQPPENQPPPKPATGPSTTAGLG